MGAVVFLTAPDDLCSGCLQPRDRHRVHGRWVGCPVVLGASKDPRGLARLLRRAQLQTRLLKVSPGAIDVDGTEAR